MAYYLAVSITARFMYLRYSTVIDDLNFFITVKVAITVAYCNNLAFQENLALVLLFLPVYNTLINRCLVLR